MNLSEAGLAPNLHSLENRRPHNEACVVTFFSKRPPKMQMRYIRKHTVEVLGLTRACFLQTIRAVAAKERVSLWFPVSMAQYSVYEALACYLMPPDTICCTTDAHLTALLNDKVKFTDYAKQLGLAVPEAFPVTSKEQLREYNRRCGRVVPSSRSS